MRPILLLTGLTLGLSGPALADDTALSPLPTLDIDPSAISVMGVSSGGYMATQLAVAFPETFSGLAIFAAGPWGCAQGSLRLALGQCMSLRHGPPNQTELDGRHAAYLAQERVGDPQALAEQRVYVWHGSEDDIVDPQLGDALASQYREWLENPDQLLQVRAEGVGHGWPVGDTGLAHITELADCRLGGSPYLLACERGAGEALQWLHDDELTPPNEQGRGMLQTFDQSEFHNGPGLAERGYLYLPKACEEGAPCGLVVALHGCNMSAEQIDEAFVRYSGLNEWAATNRLAILYPQASASLANPQGCWDWWGFAESSWQPAPVHDSREGRQVGALMSMIARLNGSDRSEENAASP